MAKTIEEMRELLSTELFQKGVKDNHIVIDEMMTTIQYNCKTNTKRRFQNSEETVQAEAFLKLIYKYNYLPQNISINESIQIGNERREVNIIVYDKHNNKILIVVECVAESANERQFQVAVDRSFSYAHASAASYVWVTSGVKNEYFEILRTAPVKKAPISEIPQQEGKVNRFKYTKGGIEPEKTTQGDLILKFKSAHNALWGGGALAPTTAFDELDKLIFCKIWDERWRENNPKTKGEPFDFQIIYYPEDKEDRSNLKAKTELERRVRSLYEQGRKKDSEVFKDDIKLDKHKIFTVVQYLQDINLSETDLDTKGLAFQSFMGGFFRGDFGQFFTPNIIVDFIVKTIGVRREYKVLDTSCGSGGFLLHALKAIRDEANEIYGDDRGTSWFKYWHDFAENNLFGIEINEQISRVAKMNMIIHDDGHTNIITNDGLKSNRSIEIENRNLKFIDNSFDLIMTNPPFGSKIKADEVSYYKDYELFETNLGIANTKERITDDNSKKKWRTSQNTEILFLEKCHKYLKEGGYLAIVIPDGILTNATNQFVRDWMVEKFRIWAIVSLPQHTFAHVKAEVKSSILFLQKHPRSLTEKFEKTLVEIKAKMQGKKGLNKEEKILELYKEQIFQYSSDYEVLMAEVENIGYDNTGKKVEGNELPEVSNRIKEFIHGNK